MKVLVPRGERTQNQNLPSFEDFLDQLVWDGHLKEFVDQKKTRSEEAEDVEAKPNTRFDRSNEETYDTQEEDFPLGTIH